MQTSLANAMEIAADKTTLDEYVVKVFSHKSVLSILLKYCVQEFYGFSADYILENCFLGDPVVRKIAVDQDVPDPEDVPDIFEGLEEEPVPDKSTEKLFEPAGVTYDALLDGNEKIDGMNTVDKTQREGTVIYDIIFLAKIPQTNDIIELIINVEIQNDEKLKYFVVTRGLYYCARMISAQKNRVFKHMDYHKIKKVYSLWICPYSETNANTVTTYDIRERKVYGKAAIPKEAYDKLETIVITLNAKGLKSKNELIRFLSLLLSHEKSLNDRQKELAEDYHLQMNEELKGDVDRVCNYSDAILRRGINQTTITHIKNLMETLKCDPTNAMNLLKIPDDERARYLKVLKRGKK